MNIWCLADLTHFDSLVLDISQAFLQAPEVHADRWQSRDVRDDPRSISYELAHAHIEMPVGSNAPVRYAQLVWANLTWAEDHFQERVGGWPLNPPPSEAWWPFAQAGNAEHKDGEKFSHTYPERFWPKQAGMDEPHNRHKSGHVGVRFAYGDLHDVIKLIQSDPATRQAYLPVWFPEDTGSVSMQRVPCTIGYQFMIRRGIMDIEYTIRSCDFMRHWHDDVYMAGRLLQWVCSEVSRAVKVKPGKLVMNIGSFHIFQPDRYQLQSRVIRLQTERSARLMSAL